jgi:hypothetical protein
VLTLLCFFPLPAQGVSSSKQAPGQQSQQQQEVVLFFGVIDILQVRGSNQTGPDTSIWSGPASVCADNL